MYKRGSKAFTATLPICLDKVKKNTVVHAVPVAQVASVIEHFFQDQTWWYLEEGVSERLPNDRPFKGRILLFKSLPVP